MFHFRSKGIRIVNIIKATNRWSSRGLVRKDQKIHAVAEIAL